MNESNPYSSGDYYEKVYSPVKHSLQEATQWMKNYYHIAEQIFPGVRRYKDRKILEIGSSFGGFVNNLNNSGFKNVVASDMSADIFPKELKNRFLTLDITDCKQSEQFDIIFAFDVMEHINDTEAAISSIKQLLHKGGIFIFCTPFPVEKHLYDPFHTNMQLPHYYTNLFHRHGFQLLKIQDISILPFIWRFGWPVFLKRIIRNKLFISETFFVFKKNK